MDLHSSSFVASFLTSSVSPPASFSFCFSVQYARIPLSGSAFSPYDFPELLELQDFWRVFSELLRLPIFPMDILEAAFLSSSALMISRELVCRAFKQKKSKSFHAKMEAMPCFAAAAAALAPCPQPFRFVLREECQGGGAWEKGFLEVANIKGGTALRDAAARALLAGGAGSVKEKAEAGERHHDSKKEKCLVGGEGGAGKEQDAAPAGDVLQNGVVPVAENGGTDEDSEGVVERKSSGGFDGDDDSERGGGGRSNRLGGKDKNSSSSSDRMEVPDGAPDASALGCGDSPSASHKETEPSSSSSEPLPAVKSEGTREGTSTPPGTPAAPSLQSSSLPSAVTCQGESAGSDQDAGKCQVSPAVAEDATSSTYAAFLPHQNNTFQFPLLRSTAFPVFLSDAVYLRLLQLAFLHVQEALSRHAKAASSTTEKGTDGTGGGMETRHPAALPLGVSSASSSVALLASSAASGTSALGSAAVAVQGFGCGGLPGTSAEIPAAATWLGVGDFPGDGGRSARCGDAVEAGGVSPGDKSSSAGSAAGSQSAPSGGDEVAKQHDVRTSGAVPSHLAAEGVSLQNNVFRGVGPERSPFLAGHNGPAFLPGTAVGRTVPHQERKNSSFQRQEEGMGGTAKAGGSSGVYGGSSVRNWLGRPPGLVQQLRRLVPQEEMHDGGADSHVSEEVEVVKEKGRDQKYGATRRAERGREPAGGSGEGAPSFSSEGRAAKHAADPSSVASTTDGYDTEEDEEEPEVLRLLNGVPPDLRLMDFLTWPLVLQRMLFDCLYTPRRVAVKKPRKMPQLVKPEQVVPDEGRSGAGSHREGEEERGEDKKSCKGGIEDDDEDGEEQEKGEDGEKKKKKQGFEPNAGAEDAEDDGERNDTSDRSKEDAPQTELHQREEGDMLQGGGDEEVRGQEQMAEPTGSASGPLSDDPSQPAATSGTSSHSVARPAPPGVDPMAGLDGSPVHQEQEGGEGVSSASSDRPAHPSASLPGGNGGPEELPCGARGEQPTGPERARCRETASGSARETGLSSDSFERGEERQDLDRKLDDEASQAGDEEKEESIASGPNAEEKDQADTREGEGDFEDGASVSSLPQNHAERGARKRKREREKISSYFGGGAAGEESGDEEDREDAGAAKTRKAAAMKKRVKRAAGDGGAPSEDEEDKQRGGGGEEEDDEEEEIEEVERLEWHLDDVKAAQCGMTPTRVELMALVFNEMRYAALSSRPR